MALTDVQIANLALSRIGTNRQITDLSDGSPEGRAITALLNVKVLPALLAAHSWGWATLQVDLVEAELLSSDYDATSITFEEWEAALLVEDTDDLHGVPEPIDYARVFYTPADCVTVIKIWPGTRAPGQDQRTPFARRSASYRVIDYITTVDPETFEQTHTKEVTDTPFDVILTDETEPRLFYVSNSTDLLRPFLFDQAVAAQLAAELAMSIRNDAGLARSLGQQAMFELQQAISHDLNGQQVDPPAESAFITARY